MRGSKKLFLVVLALILISTIAFASAEDVPNLPPSGPLRILWDKIVELSSKIASLFTITGDLQSQIDNIELIPGPQGSQGEQGPKGDTGANGLSAYEVWLGLVGTGYSEADFIAYLKGEKGDTGEQGPQGEQGPAGTCSCSITTEMYNNLLARIEALENNGACVPERCNGVDDDCDGTVDDGFDVGIACLVGVGACQRAGYKVCSIDGLGTICNVQAGNPSTEICNGVDDDCDGSIDENGVCITPCVTDGECQSGYYCNAGSCVVKKANGAACTASNQCTSSYCSDGYCCNSACSGACDTCSQALGATTNGQCSLLAAGSSGNPSCSPYVCDGLSGSCPTNCQTEVCDGMDNDCDSLVDEGSLCSYTNGVGSCVLGACSLVSCSSGYGNCNMIASDGCETNVVSDVDHCGDCLTTCTSLPHVTSSLCINRACAINLCIYGYANCDGMTSTGCETNIFNDENNCGACYQPCSSNNVILRLCTLGICDGICGTGWADCNNNIRFDGCESYLLSDPSNCGSCKHACGGGSTCQNGACSCPSGYYYCEGTKSCVSSCSSCSGATFGCASSGTCVASCAGSCSGTNNCAANNMCVSSCASCTSMPYTCTQGTDVKCVLNCNVANCNVPPGTCSS